MAKTSLSQKEERHEKESNRTRKGRDKYRSYGHERGTRENVITQKSIKNLGFCKQVKASPCRDNYILKHYCIAKKINKRSNPPDKFNVICRRLGLLPMTWLHLVTFPAKLTSPLS